MFIYLVDPCCCQQSGFERLSPGALVPEPVIRALPPNEAARRLDELAALLVDAVESGASVNFMRGLSLDEAAGFWRGQLPGLADGSRVLVTADVDGRIVGTAVVTFAHQPNQPHRAEIGKMLVHSSLRRHGLGARLLSAAEATARTAGRTLLVLDTESGSAGERLYVRSGWIKVGQIPNFSFDPDGHLRAASIFYKEVQP
jgi:GNAT superfamily N-acetyltransferase